MFVCDMDFPDETLIDECGQLCEALLAQGASPLILRAWGAHPAHAAPLRAAKLQETPYPVYCAQDVRQAAPLLALLEQATVVIALGRNPPATAQSMLDAGIPCLAWFFDQSSLRSVPAGTMDARLGLAAASTALAAQLAVMTGLPVSALQPPSTRLPPCAANEASILVPGSRRADGIQRVVEMARLRPQYRFAVLTDTSPAPECVLQTAAQTALNASPHPLPLNLSAIAGEKTPPPARLALLPSLDGTLPWKNLGNSLAAGIPVLGSSEALLVDALGAAGSTLPASAPLASWLKRLDSLMNDDTEYAMLAKEASRQGALLRPPPEQAARQCLALIERHLHTGTRRLTGRL